MASNAVGDERPTLFLRKATGLVRGWSVRDSMIYACLSTNVITLGLVEFAYQDDFESVELLLRAGARVKAVNRYGITPLTLAITNGDSAMVEALLSRLRHYCHTVHITGPSLREPQG